MLSFKKKLNTRLKSATLQREDTMRQIVFDMIQNKKSNKRYNWKDFKTAGFNRSSLKRTIEFNINRDMDNYKQVELARRGPCKLPVDVLTDIREQVNFIMDYGVSLTSSNFRLLAAHLWLGREPNSAVPYLLPQQMYRTLRDKLELKFSKKTSVDRVPNPREVRDFYDILQKLIEHHNLGPNDILNLDETKICENDQRNFYSLVQNRDQKMTNARTITYQAMTVSLLCSMNELYPPQVILGTKRSK